MDYCVFTASRGWRYVCRFVSLVHFDGDTKLWIPCPTKGTSLCCGPFVKSQNEIVKGRDTVTKLDKLKEDDEWEKLIWHRTGVHTHWLANRWVNCGWEGWLTAGIICVIVIIIIILVIAFIIYNYVPETNHVSSVHSVAVVLYLDLCYM